MIVKARPDFSKFYVPKGNFRKKLYHLVNSPWFELGIMVCIMLNILVMVIFNKFTKFFIQGLDYEGSSKSYQSILENINYVFTAVFIIECLLKISAFGNTKNININFP